MDQYNMSQDLLLVEEEGHDLGVSHFEKDEDRYE